MTSDVFKRAAPEAPKPKGSRVDAHSHTRGSDGTGTPEAIAKAAKAAGIDVLALTDHHSSETPEAAEVAAALTEVGIVPIVAVEYSTHDGHLLVYGYSVPKGHFGMYPTMQDVVDHVNAHGGACVSPHPYKGYQRAVKGRFVEVRGLAAVESLNGQLERDDSRLNREARDQAKKFNIPRVGNSDAHSPGMLGACFTQFPGTIRDVADYVEALRAGVFEARRNDTIMKAVKSSRPTTWSGWAHEAPAQRSLALVPHREPSRDPGRDYGSNYDYDAIDEIKREESAILEMAGDKPSMGRTLKCMCPFCHVVYSEVATSHANDLMRCYSCNKSFYPGVNMVRS